MNPPAQLILPFREWNVFPVWGSLLAIVNAWARRLSSYDPEQFGIYLLKDLILERHGIPDGTDLQVITLHCRACEGRGYFGFQYHEICRACLGEREYARDYITLQRFRLGAHVFHRPDKLSRFRVLQKDRDGHWTPTGEGHRTVIRGHVSRNDVPHWRWKWLALFILVARFNPAGLPHAFALWYYNRKRAARAWWSFGGGAVWRWRLERARQGLPVVWEDELDTEDVPF